MALLLQKRLSCLVAKDFSRFSVQNVRHVAQLCAATEQQGVVTSKPQQSRAYPDEPRVGVGIVVFREPVTQPDQSPEVLLIRRAKEPAKGQWCFPGGSLELGETIAACAAREVLEETGVPIRNTPGSASGDSCSHSLHQPRPLSANDDICHDDSGRLSYHYVVVEVAAMAANPHAQLRPSDDADAVQWLPVNQLRTMANLWKSQYTSKLAEDAWKKYGLNMCHG